MANVTVSGVFHYPVKSCRGTALQQAELDQFGLSGDRRWLLVDADGCFQTQREHAQLALMDAHFDGATLELGYRGERCEVVVPGTDAPELDVQIWHDRVIARLADEGASRWVSALLGVDLRLVYMPDDCRRQVDTDYARHSETVSFADGFPLLLISQASLDDLNSRLDNPVPMNRFRPNIVVEGCEAFAEDQWQQLTCGHLVFDVVKPCSRCVIPSIDQATGEKDRQINRVLAGYRRRDGKIYFGQNLLSATSGTIAVGDQWVIEH